MYCSSENEHFPTKNKYFIFIYSHVAHFKGTRPVNVQVIMQVCSMEESQVLLRGGYYECISLTLHYIYAAVFFQLSLEKSLSIIIPYSLLEPAKKLKLG